jgi:WD40 repeat protein
MAERKQSRKRGVVLTVVGYRKLEAARIAREQAANLSVRYTNEELSAITGLSLMTLGKIFTGTPDPTIAAPPVDKRTLDVCFRTFDLNLARSDYDYIDDIERSLAVAVTSSRFPTLDRSLPGESDRFDLGESPDVSIFYGRGGETDRLQHWVSGDRCRLVAILGMGGVGKTTLATKLAHELQSQFDRVIWRSLRNAPALGELLPQIIAICSDGAEILPPTVDISTQITRLLAYLRQQRCLLVLDNAEAIIADRPNLDRGTATDPHYAQLFERIGASAHQSCLVLTSREKPIEMLPLEGEQLPVRSLLLRGLDGDDVDCLLDAKGLSDSIAGRARLLALYSGNPLALNIVATSIRDLYEGDIDGFLAADETIFGDIRQLLDRQFDRLSPLEQTVMYWLAIEREWTAPADLHDQIVPITTKPKLLNAFTSLSRRSLIEQSNGKFTQQAVVMEYATARLLDRIATELDDWDESPETAEGLPLWLQYPLFKSQSPVYIQTIQTRLFLQPIASQLQLQFPQTVALTERLQTLVAELRDRYPRTPHYGGGNLFNLLRHLHIDVTGWNFANLAMWQADFQGTTLYNVNLSGTDLSRAMFTCAFGWVISIAYSLDSQLLLTGEASGNIGLWQLANRELVDTLTGHTSWVWAMEFSPDGRVLATASQDTTVRIWDFASRQVLRIFQADNQQVQCLAFHPDGRRILTGHSCGRVRIWNLETGAIEHTIVAHDRQVFLLKVSSDGRLAATASDDGIVKMWDLPTLTPLDTLDSQTARIWSVKFSPDDGILATGCSDGTIKLWSLASAEVLATLPGYSQWIVSASFSPNGRMLATAHSDTDIKVWDVSRIEEWDDLPPRPLATLFRQSALAALVEFSPDSQLLITGDTDRSMKLWSTATWIELARWEGHTNGITALALTAGGERAICACHDGIVRVWDLHTGAIVLTLRGHDRGLFAVDYDPHHQSIVSTSEDRTLKLWDAQTGELLHTLKPESGAAWSVKFSPDGRCLASAGTGGKIDLWSQAGALIKTLSGHHGAVKSICFSPDGKLLASASFDLSWRLWDLETGAIVHTEEGYSNWIWHLAFSPDGRWLAISGVDGVAELWEVATCKRRQTFTGHFQEVLTLTFSPDSQQLATGGADRAIKTWDVETGEMLQTLLGHFDRVNSLCYGADGKSLCSVSGDETLKIWELNTGNCLHSYQPPSPYLGMQIDEIEGLTHAGIGSLQLLGANA